MAKDLKELYESETAHFAVKPELVVLTVQKGAAAFSRDLLEALYDLGIDARTYNVSASSYGSETKSSGNVKVEWWDSPDQLRDAFVVVAEDLSDTGLTLKVIVDELLQVVPAEVVIAVLLDKKDALVYPIDTPKIVGFAIKDWWIQGKGIDTRGKGRGSRDVSVVVNDADTIESAQLIAEVQLQRLLFMHDAYVLNEEETNSTYAINPNLMESSMV